MALFGNTISRPISPSDMEFYESGLVLRLAVLLSGYSEEVFNGLSPRSRNRWLDKARDAACKLFNERDVATKLLPLAKNLAERI